MFLAHIFVRVILPVFVVIGLGYIYGRTNEVDPRPFARVAWYVTGPCLAFAALVTTVLPDDDFARIFLFVIVTTLAMWPVAILSAAWLRLDRQTASAFQLSVLFGNVVNYGFPVLLFAFGTGGLERGVVYMTGNQVLLATIAVFVASRGRAEWRQSLANIFRVPMLYASILGFLVNRLAVVIPQPIFELIRLVGEANLMLMLLILGMQLARVQLKDGRLAVVVSTGLKLVVSVGVGVVAAVLLGMEGLTRQASIAEAGTPSAVYAAIIAAEYDVAPGFAAACVFVSTLVSMLTLTVVLAWLGVR